MTSGWRQGWVFAVGTLVGAALAVWAYATWFGEGRQRDPVAAAPAAVRPPVAPEAAEAVAAAAALGPVACTFEPMVVSTGAADGKFALHPTASNASDPSAFLAVAQEAAGQGRNRDAEVAWIAACRVAAQGSGVPSAPVADVKTQLGTHYATLASRTPAGDTRRQLLQRAQALFGETAQTYGAALGPNASKTRLATQRLAAVERLAQGPAVIEAPVQTAEPAPGETSRMGATTASLATRPPLQSEGIAELESDLERLYAQVRAVTKDPAGLERRRRQALARRSACGDEACLRNWAAQHKRQLFSEF